jgi:hypothetical protein
VIYTPRPTNAIPKLSIKLPRGMADGSTSIPCAPQVLIPFSLAEALTVAEAARTAGVTARTMRSWCNARDIGRRVGGTWRVSKIALAMHLDNDWEVLRLYLGGDRHSAAIIGYFERCGVPLPRQVRVP